MIQRCLILLFLACVFMPANAEVYFVSPEGDNSKPGSMNEPWLTWGKGFLRARPGDTVYIRGGTYPVSSFFQTIEIKHGKGSPDSPISIMNYPGEKPILDLAELGRAGSYNYGIRMEGCEYWRLRGLVVANVPEPSFGYAEGVAVRNCRGMLLENMLVHDCGGDGYVISEVRGEVRVINCDAYNNASSDRENGNGFTFSFTSNPESRVSAKGCRAWHNLDDGFDCWDFNGLVSFDSCWAFNNGFNGGDGDGFKLGKISDGPHNRRVRILRHCLAFQNILIGFDQNGCSGVKEFYHCVAFENTYAGYAADDHLLDVFHNNITFKNGTNWLNDTAVHSNNSWDIKGISPTDSDFVSLDPEGMDGPRLENGSLPHLDFLQLKPGSDMIDAGKDIGLEFHGDAPDLGVYEQTK